MPPPDLLVIVGGKVVQSSMGLQVTRSTSLHTYGIITRKYRMKNTGRKFQQLCRNYTWKEQRLGIGLGIWARTSSSFAGNRDMGHKHRLLQVETNFIVILKKRSVAKEPFLMWQRAKPPWNLDSRCIRCTEQLGLLPQQGVHCNMEIEQWHHETILRAVHQVLCFSWVYPTITIVIVRVNFRYPLSSKSEIGGVIIWVDSLKYGWHGHLVEHRCLDVTCWFFITKSKRSKWFSGNQGLSTGSKKLQLILQKLILRSCTEETCYNYH